MCGVSFNQTEKLVFEDDGILMDVNHARNCQVRPQICMYVCMYSFNYLFIFRSFRRKLEKSFVVLFLTESPSKRGLMKKSERPI